ncbi:mannose-P-dolichol utilization defect 1 protein-like isoform X2 [Tubulanus polymorphus]|uniref:mannose-P-dolichol utilization defect 1 protein-like isoform X2 n=1 Tax=Tubulanus polymorphus TaxID=672921 RepID=UPI003DA4EF34
MADQEVKPVSNMFENWLQMLVPQPCYDEFFVKHNFFEVVCLKILLSKVLGYAIIVGSVLVKLPQIVKILSAKSGAGISMLSIIMELVAIASAAAYGWAMKYPFSAYGEGIFLMIQTTLIGFFVLIFGGQMALSFVFIGVFGGSIAYLMSPAAPIELLRFLQASNMPVVAVSKIIANYRNGSTGQLSAITLLLLFAGSLARIFTSIQETGDNLIIVTYVVASVCNGLLVLQLVYYWNTGAAAGKKQNKKQQNRKKKQ